jgi:hypothetical protein
MNFFSFISLKTEIDKVYNNCLKKPKPKREMTKEEKEDSNKRYELWKKNTYNPFLNYYSSREDVKK